MAICGYTTSYSGLAGALQNRGEDIGRAISEKYQDFDAMVLKYWTKHVAYHQGDKKCYSSFPITIELEVITSKMIENQDGNWIWIQLAMCILRGNPASKRSDCYEKCGKLCVQIKEN